MADTGLNPMHAEQRAETVLFHALVQVYLDMYNTDQLSKQARSMVEKLGFANFSRQPNSGAAIMTGTGSVTNLRLQTLYSSIAYLEFKNAANKPDALMIKNLKEKYPFLTDDEITRVLQPFPLGMFLHITEDMATSYDMTHPRWVSTGMFAFDLKKIIMASLYYRLLPIFFGGLAAMGLGAAAIILGGGTLALGLGSVVLVLGTLAMLFAGVNLLLKKRISLNTYNFIKANYAAKEFLPTQVHVDNDDNFWVTPPTLSILITPQLKRWADGAVNKVSEFLKAGWANPLNWLNPLFRKYIGATMYYPARGMREYIYKFMPIITLVYTLKLLPLINFSFFYYNSLNTVFGLAALAPFLSIGIGVFSAVIFAMVAFNLLLKASNLIAGWVRSRPETSRNRWLGVLNKAFYPSVVVILASAAGLVYPLMAGSGLALFLTTISLSYFSILVYTFLLFVSFVSSASTYVSIMRAAGYTKADTKLMSALQLIEIPTMLSALKSGFIKMTTVFASTPQMKGYTPLAPREANEMLLNASLTLFVAGWMILSLMFGNIDLLFGWLTYALVGMFSVLNIPVVMKSFMFNVPEDESFDNMFQRIGIGFLYTLGNTGILNFVDDPKFSTNFSRAKRMILSMTGLLTASAAGLGLALAALAGLGIFTGAFAGVLASAGSIAVLLGVLVAGTAAAVLGLRFDKIFAFIKPYNKFHAFDANEAQVKKWFAKNDFSSVIKRWKGHQELDKQSQWLKIFLVLSMIKEPFAKAYGKLLSVKKDGVGVLKQAYVEFYAYAGMIKDLPWNANPEETMDAGLSKGGNLRERLEVSDQMFRDIAAALSDIMVRRQEVVEKFLSRFKQGQVGREDLDIFSEALLYLVTFHDLTVDAYRHNLDQKDVLGAVPDMTAWRTIFSQPAELKKGLKALCPDSSAETRLEALFMERPVFDWRAIAEGQPAAGVAPQGFAVQHIAWMQALSDFMVKTLLLKGAEPARVEAITRRLVDKLKAGAPDRIEFVQNPTQFWWTKWANVFTSVWRSKKDIMQVIRSESYTTNETTARVWFAQQNYADLVRAGRALDREGMLSVQTVRFRQLYDLAQILWEGNLISHDLERKRFNVAMPRYFELADLVEKTAWNDVLDTGNQYRLRGDPYQRGRQAFAIRQAALDAMDGIAKIIWTRYQDGLHFSEAGNNQAAVASYKSMLGLLNQFGDALQTHNRLQPMMAEMNMHAIYFALQTARGEPLKKVGRGVATLREFRQMMPRWAEMSGIEEVPNQDLDRVMDKLIRNVESAMPPKTIRGRYLIMTPVRTNVIAKQWSNRFIVINLLIVAMVLKLFLGNPHYSNIPLPNGSFYEGPQKTTVYFQGGQYSGPVYNVRTPDGGLIVLPGPPSFRDGSLAQPGQNLEEEAYFRTYIEDNRQKFNLYPNPVDGKIVSLWDMQTTQPVMMEGSYPSVLPAGTAEAELTAEETRAWAEVAARLKTTLYFYRVPNGQLLVTAELLKRDDKGALYSNVLIGKIKDAKGEIKIGVVQGVLKDEPSVVKDDQGNARESQTKFLSVVKGEKLQGYESISMRESLAMDPRTQKPQMRKILVNKYFDAKFGKFVSREFYVYNCMNGDRIWLEKPLDKNLFFVKSYQFGVALDKSNVFQNRELHWVSIYDDNVIEGKLTFDYNKDLVPGGQVVELPKEKFGYWDEAKFISVPAYVYPVWNDRNDPSKGQGRIVVAAPLQGGSSEVEFRVVKGEVMPVHGSFAYQDKKTGGWTSVIENHTVDGWSSMDYFDKLADPAKPGEKISREYYSEAGKSIQGTFHKYRMKAEPGLGEQFIYLPVELNAQGKQDVQYDLSRSRTPGFAYQQKDGRWVSVIKTGETNSTFNGPSIMDFSPYLASATPKSTRTIKGLDEFNQGRPLVLYVYEAYTNREHKGTPQELPLSVPLVDGKLAVDVREGKITTGSQAYLNSAKNWVVAQEGMDFHGQPEINLSKFSPSAQPVKVIPGMQLYDRNGVKSSIPQAYVYQVTNKSGVRQEIVLDRKLGPDQRIFGKKVNGVSVGSWVYENEDGSLVSTYNGAPVHGVATVNLKNKLKDPTSAGTQELMHGFTQQGKYWEKVGYAHAAKDGDFFYTPKPLIDGKTTEEYRYGESVSENRVYEGPFGWVSYMAGAPYNGVEIWDLRAYNPQKAGSPKVIPIYRDGVAHMMKVQEYSLLIPGTDRYDKILLPADMELGKEKTLYSYTHKGDVKTRVRIYPQQQQHGWNTELRVNAPDFVLPQPKAKTAGYKISEGPAPSAEQLETLNRQKGQAQIQTEEGQRAKTFGDYFNQALQKIEGFFSWLGQLFNNLFGVAGKGLLTLGGVDTTGTRAPSVDFPMTELPTGALRPDTGAVGMGAVMETGFKTQDPMGAQVYWGVGLDGQDFNLPEYEQKVGAKVATVNIFSEWTAAGDASTLEKARLAIAEGAVPMVTWEPWKAWGLPHPEGISLKDITQGKYDQYIDNFAKQMKTLNQPVVIRSMHEFNGNWYPWAIDGTKVTAEDYKKAFRYLHNRLAAQGLKFSMMWSVNAESVGSPISLENLKAAYPGDDVVDVVGISGYKLNASDNREIGQLLGPCLDAIAKVAPNKPVIIAETGTIKAGDPAKWWGDLANFVGLKKQIIAVVPFDVKKNEGNFKVQKGPELDSFHKIVHGNKAGVTGKGLLQKLGWQEPKRNFITVFNSLGMSARVFTHLGLGEARGYYGLAGSLIGGTLFILVAFSTIYAKLAKRVALGTLPTFGSGEDLAPFADFGEDQPRGSWGHKAAVRLKQMFSVSYEYRGKVYLDKQAMLHLGESFRALYILHEEVHATQMRQQEKEIEAFTAMVKAVRAGKGGAFRAGGQEQGWLNRGVQSAAQIRTRIVRAFRPLTIRFLTVWMLLTSVLPNFGLTQMPVLEGNRYVAAAKYTPLRQFAGAVEVTVKTALTAIGQTGTVGENTKVVGGVRLQNPFSI
ncbi:MAG: hypothetical protein HGA76_02915, partial [Candidatus Firestonebacteria bacterium]|nr:hypothetical protein [Candidatus Firestonebacteria bacterium]